MFLALSSARRRKYRPVHRARHCPRASTQWRSCTRFCTALSTNKVVNGVIACCNMHSLNGPVVVELRLDRCGFWANSCLEMELKAYYDSAYSQMELKAYYNSALGQGWASQSQHMLRTACVSTTVVPSEETPSGSIDHRDTHTSTCSKQEQAFIRHNRHDMRF